MPYHLKGKSHARDNRPRPHGPRCQPRGRLDRPSRAHDRPHGTGRRHGLGYSGGELLCLAIGACYTNDIYREAAQRGIVVKNVDVDVSVDWGDGRRAQSISYTARVEAEASQDEIKDPMAHTDQVAEIHNSLRMSAPVTLTSAVAISAARSDPTTW